MKEKPKIVTDEHLEYLDELRSSVAWALRLIMATRSALLLAALLLMSHAYADQPPMCEFQKRAADFSIHHIRRGLAEADFWNVHPLPDNWAEEFKGITRRIVEAAYRWPRGEQDFIDQTVRDCK